MNRTLQAAVSMVWKPYDVTEHNAYGSFRYSLNKSYGDLLDRAGVIPRAVVPTGNISPVKLLENCDMLILTGGGDPDPSLFGQENSGSRNPERERACWDMELYRAARNLGIPVLGICLGMQLIGIAHGSPLIQDLDSEVENHAEHESADGKPVMHRVSVMSGTVLHDVMGDAVEVSSCHHQALKSIPEGFRGSAFSEDGLIEAIESIDGGVFGVQWHPERDSTGPLLMNMLKEVIARGL